MKNNLSNQLLTIATFSTFVIMALASASSNKTVKVSSSEADANIYVDGQKLGVGNVPVKVAKNACVNVKVTKVGFLNYEQTFCNNKATYLPPSQFVDMKKDDAYEASVKSDIANRSFDIEIKKGLDATEAWKLINQIVTGYFDDIETNDKETSYLKTAWSVQSYSQNTIRTRIIISLSKSSPYTIKVKLVSEYSDLPGVSAKNDEKFKEWDRVLRKYENVIIDFNSRIGIK